MCKLISPLNKDREVRVEVRIESTVRRAWRGEVDEVDEVDEVR